MPLTPSRLCLALATTGVLLAITAPAGSAVRQRLAAQAAEDASPGRVIVTYRSTRVSALSARVQAQGSGPVREAQALNQRHALDLRDGRTVAPQTQVLISDTLTSAQLREKLAADPDVASVTVDQRRYAHAAPNDPLYPAGQSAPYPNSGQWYLRAPAAPVVSAINAEGAWNRTTGSSSIVVAVLDTGVRPEHPDLKGKLLPGYDFIHQAATANDGDGIDGDPTDPGDWLSNADLTGSNRAAYTTCTSTTNSSWHGTQTASLVGAATNDGVGMASAGRNVMVLPVRVLGKCGGFDSDIVAAMRWAAGLTVPGTSANPTPAKVINMSLGNPGACGAGSLYPGVVAELAQVGAVVVASAGNDDLAVNTPANCDGIVAVAGLRHAGDKSGFSSLGSQVHIAAPGGNCEDTGSASALCKYAIISANNAGTINPTTSRWTDAARHDGDYEGLGTSFSAPLVSATAALMLSVNPSLTVAQIKTLLASSARPFPTTGGIQDSQCLDPSSEAASAASQVNCYCNTSTCGAGMLDSQAAVAAASAGRAVAHMGSTPPIIIPGSSVTLDGSASSAASSATLSTYAWDIVSGSDAATITSAANASTVTLLTDASKTGSRVIVRLTVTDTLGNIGSATQTLSLGTPPGIASIVPATTSAPADSSGGGAFDAAWALLGLAAAGAAWQVRRRPR